MTNLYPIRIKPGDFGFRPVLLHWTAPRVRADVFLRMLAHYVELHMRSRLAPILFGYHDRVAAAADRQSIVVAPAVRSPAEKRTVTSRRTDDGLPADSCHSVINDRGRTLCPNTGSMPSNRKYRFNLPIDPTPFQTRAFELVWAAERRLYEASIGRHYRIGSRTC